MTGMENFYPPPDLKAKYEAFNSIESDTGNQVTLVVPARTAYYFRKAVMDVRNYHPAAREALPRFFHGLSDYYSPDREKRDQAVADILFALISYNYMSTKYPSPMDFTRDVGSIDDLAETKTEVDEMIRMSALFPADDSYRMRLTMPKQTAIDFSSILAHGLSHSRLKDEYELADRYTVLLQMLRDPEFYNETKELFDPPVRIDDTGNSLEMIGKYFSRSAELMDALDATSRYGYKGALDLITRNPSSGKYAVLTFKADYKGEVFRIQFDSALGITVSSMTENLALHDEFAGRLREFIGHVQGSIFPVYTAVHPMQKIKIGNVSIPLHELIGGLSEEQSYNELLYAPVSNAYSKLGFRRNVQLGFKGIPVSEFRDLKIPFKRIDHLDTPRPNSIDPVLLKIQRLEKKARVGYVIENKNRDVEEVRREMLREKYRTILT